MFRKSRAGTNWHGCSAADAKVAVASSDSTGTSVRNSKWRTGADTEEVSTSTSVRQHVPEILGKFRRSYQRRLCLVLALLMSTLAPPVTATDGCKVHVPVLKSTQLPLSVIAGITFGCMRTSRQRRCTPSSAWLCWVYDRCVPVSCRMHICAPHTSREREKEAIDRNHCPWAALPHALSTRHLLTSYAGSAPGAGEAPCGQTAHGFERKCVLSGQQERCGVDEQVRGLIADEGELSAWGVSA
jgi:hypothetical protein